MKPYEVEILVAEVGDGDDDDAEMYHILYDGVVMDEQGYTVLGGQAEAITEALKAQYTDRHRPRRGGPARRARCSATDGRRRSSVDQLEVALLDRSRPRRAFRRIKNAELEGILAS